MLQLLYTMFPVFAMIAAGYAAERFGWLQVAHSESLNRFVYYVSFPVLLFGVLAHTPTTEIADTPFLVAWTASMLAGYALACAISTWRHGDGLAAMGVRSMNATCGNTAMMGIPVALAAFGPRGQLLAVLATTVLVIVNVSLTVLLLEAGRHTNGARRVAVAKIVAALVRNPLVIGVVAGIAYGLAFGAPPAPLARLTDLLGAAAIPCSLVSTGLFFAGQRNRNGARFSAAPTFTLFKLIVQPGIAYAISCAFGLDRWTTAVVVLLSAMPPASTSFVIAQRYGILVEETSSMTIVSTAVSVLTLSLLLAWAKP
ncbi:hypothetical protein WI73_21125 [Burkholderia ubonensis]|uniref:AEC family transporter n=1 Tax=Burkholderia ubonensis TaxID=101571 RepID=UPI00075CF36A|nr:AEC family transporter [Burkholderia ubonensis]AYZ64663.1 AEC family transporter [Burkholderia multivorans]AOI68040.1 hypothetical protein WI31_00060 [Burkholderia ubonensis]KUZ23001.1 hypothetical protein WI29_12390 [Burkholderia ubonensis]KUZ24749.1 hypothetical protein WI32_33560 [Burkholderia ubonensis]KUZ36681.1 hypothetical protein WI30_08140 [Burkholderia ubonensis]